MYSGRMPILFVIVLIATSALVRVAQGRTAFPRGHHLLVKLSLVLVLFVIYSSAMWASRQNFCVEMNGLVRELQEELGAAVPSVDSSTSSKTVWAAVIGNSVTRR